jgi:hypothetical protein
LENSFFQDNITFECDENIISLGITLEDLDRIWIGLHGNNLNKNIKVLNRLVSYVNNFTDASSDLKSSVISRINYQIFLLKLDDSWNSSRCCEFIKLWTINLLVKNGYRGTSRLFGISFIIMLFFSFLILFIKSIKDEILLHINYDLHKYEENSQKRHDILLTLSHKNKILQFIQCFWFSFQLFVSPKFPADYFKLSTKVQCVILSEWIVGCSMVTLYLWFVIDKYQILKVLFGI